MRNTSDSTQRGSIFVEFALFFILFITLLLGLMEMSLLIWTKASMTHAARQGARSAAVFRSMGLDDTAIKSLIRNQAVGSGVEPTDITLRYEALTKDAEGNVVWVTDASRARGSFVEVEIVHTHTLATSLILPVKQINLKAASRALILN